MSIEQPSVPHAETKDGFPILPYEIYAKRVYKTLREIGEKNPLSLDYQGFVRMDEADETGEQPLFYKDLLVSAGLSRKEDAKTDISLRTMGHAIIDEAPDSRFTSPEQLDHYRLMLHVPVSLQKELDQILKYDHVYSQQEFRETYNIQANEDFTQDEERRPDEWIEQRLPFAVKQDPLARKRALYVHIGLLLALRKNPDLHHVHQIVDTLVAEIQLATAEELEEKLSSIN